jgi:hypothetical protein
MYVRTWPLGKLVPPRGATITLTSGGSGRGRRMKALIIVESRAPPQASVWNTAARRRPLSDQAEMISGGISRDCGGKPGHEATRMSSARAGCCQPCSRMVMARSKAALRFARTAARRAVKEAIARPIVRSGVARIPGLSQREGYGPLSASLLAVSAAID